MDIIGWTYEAAIHCTPCARRRFGRALWDDDTEDAEGNPIHPIFESDELDPDGEYCDDCGESIS